MMIDEADLIDFQLYGLASSYSDSSHFIYHVNLKFETQFIRSDDLDVVIENQISYFPVFEWKNQRTGVYYNIIKNQAYTLNSEKNSSNLSSMFAISPYLINQHKQYNFLLKVTGDESFKIPVFENSFIQMISSLDTSKIKKINRLIF